jgi:hypothetical protein
MQEIIFAGIFSLSGIEINGNLNSKLPFSGAMQTTHRCPRYAKAI